MYAPAMQPSAHASDAHQLAAQALSALVRIGERPVPLIEGPRTFLDRGAYTAMALLHTSGPMRGGAIAEQLDVNPSTVSRQVSGLERDGLVARIGDSMDGRAYEVRLTDLGRVVFERTRDGKAQRLHSALTDWTEREVFALATLVERLNRDLETAAARAEVSEVVTPSISAVDRHRRPDRISSLQTPLAQSEREHP